ncbi:MAG: hypothetical protein KDC83_07565 [Flavobacteriales bacterium]|nr:hypothetical protein [Flavobacteriales bacterium]
MVRIKGFDPKANNIKGFDAYGQNVTQAIGLFQIDLSSVSIDLSGLPSGTYFLQSEQSEFTIIKR